MSVRDTPASRSHADNVEKTRRNGSPDEKPSGSISAMRPSVRTSRTERRGLAALMGSGPPRSSAAKPRTDRLRPERVDRNSVSIQELRNGHQGGACRPRVEVDGKGGQAKRSPRESPVRGGQATRSHAREARQRRTSETEPTPERPIASAEARD